MGDAFVVLSMQNDSGCPTADKVNDFMRWAINQYYIDITRIYLSGYSCGGGGVWNYIGKYISDDLIAAAVPVAVQQPPSLRFQLLQGLLLRPATAALTPHRLEPSRPGSNHSPLEQL